jgi:hypothetical protein
MDIKDLLKFFKKDKKEFSYKCSKCGKLYEETLLCFGTDYPNYYYEIPESQRKKRIQLQKSLCIIDEEHYFHRGRLIIPIVDYDKDLIFNVWTTISKDNFEKRNKYWENPNRIDNEPYFGWLQTIIPMYESTLNIKTIAIEQEVGLIPIIRSIEDNHQLTIDQNSGINYQKAKDISDQIMADYKHTYNCNC